jgi:hypothetical protein
VLPTPGQAEFRVAEGIAQGVGFEGDRAGFVIDTERDVAIVVQFVERHPGADGARFRCLDVRASEVDTDAVVVSGNVAGGAKLPEFTRYRLPVGELDFCSH